MKRLFTFLMFALLTSGSALSQTIDDYNLLLVSGGLEGDIETELEAMGHTVTIVPAASLTDAYDYSPYDAIIFSFNAAEPPGMATIIAENEACNLGIIQMRCPDVITTTGLGNDVWYSSTDFTITNNSHWITEPFALGVLDLSFTYKSNITVPASSGVTVLGTVEASGNGSLVVHDTYKRVMSPYYGHYVEMPWSAEAEVLMDRIIAWAVDDCCTETTASITETACDAYTVPSGEVTYTTSGIYTDTIPNVAGCDSILFIDVTINTVDASVTQMDELLSANASGAVYQWIDCSDSSIVTGATNQNFTPTENGDYAVIVTENGCTDTSDCYTVNNIGLIEFDNTVFSIDPNPFNETILINWSDEWTEVHIGITDLMGKVVYSEKVNGLTKLDVDLNVPKGIYFVNLHSSGNVMSKKIVRK